MTALQFSAGFLSAYADSVPGDWPGAAPKGARGGGEAAIFYTIPSGGRAPEPLRGNKIRVRTAGVTDGRP